MRPQLIALRAAMKKQGVDYYFIPTDDFHSSEYVGEHFTCRKYVSGFTGSAGTLLVTADWAGLWTDGRYFIQATAQLEGSGIELCKIGEPGVPTIPEYLKKHLQAGQVLGFDGRTVNATLYRSLQEAVQQTGAEISCEMDLVDEIWADRPALSAEPVFELPESLIGESRSSKIGKLRQELVKANADVLIMAALDCINWLLNIRGGDVACTPVVLSFAAVTQQELVLFINEATLSPEIKANLAADGVTFRPYNDIYAYVKGISPGSTAMMDLRVVNSAILSSVPEGVTVLDQPDPTELPKAIKNPTEVENFRLAHVKDGVAVTRFMRWLKENVGKIPMTEISVAQKLEEFRDEEENSMGPSFHPIIAWGPHGAIVHYSATEETNIPLEPRSFLLADTGGHYLEGSTDITRTFALGELTDEEKEIYTLVLKGHLNLAAARFRYGCTGRNFDYLARQPFWDRNMDYNHGTGHGVGYLLNIHEGPQGFRWKSTGKNEEAVFEPGMITSNEPGMYLEGKFGVRLENMIVCVEGETNQYGRFLHFENLTMVPFDLDAIVVDLLTKREKELLNAYHTQVRETLLPRLNAEDGAWLTQATRAV
jgi:Xaa-Pro aminopeptidase